MSCPKRILEVVNVMDRAGLETMLMNYYRHVDRSVVQFDFLTHRPVEGAYDKEIRDLGGCIFRAPRLYPQNCLAYRKYMRRFFAEHDYPVVHSHIDSMSAFPLAMARDCHIPVRIAHSHNDSVDKDIKYPIKEIARKHLPNIATHYWACSSAAGSYLFGEKNSSKISIVKNAIDLKQFEYDHGARIAKRKELGLADGQLAIGHVGRFSAVKNQAFLIDILSTLDSEGLDAVLVLVGDGELRSSIEKKAVQAGLLDKVLFLGLRDDISQLMQAFDVFCFPSLHEGIPLVLIEAQASGLPILTSDAVSSEALVMNNASQLSLSCSLEAWSTKVIELALCGRAQNCFGMLSAAGYEINSSALRLQNTYLSLYEGVKAQ